MPTFTDDCGKYSIELTSEELERYPDSLFSLMTSWEPLREEFVVSYLSPRNLEELSRYYRSGVWSNPWDALWADYITVDLEGCKESLWSYCNLPLPEIDYEEDVVGMDSDSETDDEEF